MSASEPLISSPSLWQPARRLHRFRRFAAPLLRRPGFLLASALVALTLLAALAPGLFSGLDPYATAPAAKLLAPNAAHWFGTDELGRDLYTRMMYGSRLSVLAALLAVGLALVCGLGLGILAGFLGGRVDALIMRVVDVLLALPGLLLALAIVTAIGFGTIPVAIAVGVGIVPGFARTTRAEVLRVKTLPYVEAARLGGASWTRTAAGRMGHADRQRSAVSDHCALGVAAAGAVSGAGGVQSQPHRPHS